MKALIQTVMALMFATSAYSADINSLIAEGDCFHAEFNNAEAVIKYQAAYSLDRDNIAALKKVIQGYVDTGEDIDGDDSEDYYKGAIKYATIMVEKYPDNAESHYLMALAMGKMALFLGGEEKVKMSRDIYKEAMESLKMDPASYKTHLLLGVYHREVANLNWFLKTFAEAFFGGLPEGTNEGSLKHLRKAIELNDDSLRAHYELGITYKIMNKKKESKQELERAMELPIIDHLDQRYKDKAKKIRKKIY